MENRMPKKNNNKNITMVIDEEILKLLKKRALERSLAEDSEINYADLIREAVDEKYGAEYNKKQV